MMLKELLVGKWRVRKWWYKRMEAWRVEKREEWWEEKKDGKLHIPHWNSSIMVAPQQASHTHPLRSSSLHLLLPHIPAPTSPTNSAMDTHHRSWTSSLHALVLQPSLPLAPRLPNCPHPEAAEGWEPAGAGHLCVHARPWEGAHGAGHGHGCLRHCHGLPIW